MRLTGHIHPFVGLAALVAMLSCSSNVDDIAGTTNTGNARVSCSVMRPDGTPARGALVRIRPDSYLADTAAIMLSKSMMQRVNATVDAQGMCALENIEPGNYYIEIWDSTGPAAVFTYVNELIIYRGTARIDLDTISLTPAGALVGKLNMRYVNRQVPGYVRIHGLERTARIDSNGMFAFSHVPHTGNLSRQSFKLNIVASYNDVPVVDCVPARIRENAEMDIGVIEHRINFVHDTTAIRALLDSNGLSAMPATKIAIVDSTTQQVTTLAARALGLHTIPPEIGELDKLQHVYLDTNQLTFLPFELASCSSLTVLSLTVNAFQRVPDVVYSCGALNELHLGGNSIDSISSAIDQLSSLQHFLAQSNKLTRLPAELFQLPGIKRMSVAANQIDYLPSTLGEAVTLEKLSLSDNHLTWLPEGLCNLVMLRELQIEKNELDSLPSCIGYRKPKLVTFDVSDNNLSDLPLSIKEIKYLGHFRISNNKLCNVSVTLETWLEQQQPGWDTLQMCP
ncbi:MAG: hypothetical protein GF398_03640 [Chitinivibrionales bacterium]|nr:hypothetical protein [Chitinivibrionales bacterium]